MLQCKVEGEEQAVAMDALLNEADKTMKSFSGYVGSTRMVCKSYWDFKVRPTDPAFLLTSPFQDSQLATQLTLLSSSFPPSRQCAESARSRSGCSPASW